MKYSAKFCIPLDMKFWGIIFEKNYYKKFKGRRVFGKVGMETSETTERILFRFPWV